MFRRKESVYGRTAILNRWHNNPGQNRQLDFWIRRKFVSIRSVNISNLANAKFSSKILFRRKINSLDDFVELKESVTFCTMVRCSS